MAINTAPIISGIYAAASGRGDWSSALKEAARALDLWEIQLIGVDNKTLRISFSVNGGFSEPHTALAYITEYGAIDPRRPLVMNTPLGQWFHCHEHFDDAFVASNSFYQDFLIPHGGRYLTATKLRDDDMTFAMALLSTGDGQPMDNERLAASEEIRFHCGEALQNMTHLREELLDTSIAKALLSQFQRPMFVVDHLCGIWHANDMARTLLNKGGVLGKVNGTLVYQGQSAENPVTAAINRLGLKDASHDGPSRVAFRLLPLDDKPYVGIATALMPNVTMGVFGAVPRVLLTLHQPGQSNATPNPEIVADCLGLSRAEGAVASLIATGKTPIEIAESRHVAESTVRSQIKAIRNKLNVDRYSEIVRLVNDLPVG